MGSRLKAIILAVLLFIIGMFLVTAYPEQYPTDQESLDNFVFGTLDNWKSNHKRNADLQVIRVDISFTDTPNCFEEDEGVVIAPVGIDMPGGQKILETVSWPPHSRVLSVDGITCLSWPYNGLVNRELKYTALALVERGKFEKPSLPKSPSFKTLPQDLKFDALAQAKNLQRDDLHLCARFHDWAVNIAGEPPYTEQFLRIIGHLMVHTVDKEKIEKNKRGDLCYAIRKEKFTLPVARKLAVMAAREVGIPSFAFSSAKIHKAHLVGIYTDQNGWLLMDLNDYDNRLYTGGPPLITRVPLLSPFEGSVNNFFAPRAAAFKKSEYFFGSDLNYINWTVMEENTRKKCRDVTSVLSFPLFKESQ